MRKYSLTVSYRLRFSTVNPRGHRGRQAPAGADRDGAEREHQQPHLPSNSSADGPGAAQRPVGQRQQVEPSDDLRQPDLPRGQGLQQRDARRGRAPSEATTQPAAGRRHQRGRGDRSRAALEPSPRDAHAPPGESTPGQALRRWVRSIEIRIFMASARSTPVGRASTDVLFPVTYAHCGSSRWRIPTGPVANPSIESGSIRSSDSSSAQGRVESAVRVLSRSRAGTTTVRVGPRPALRRSRYFLRPVCASGRC